LRRLGDRFYSREYKLDAIDDSGVNFCPKANTNSQGRVNMKLKLLVILVSITAMIAGAMKANSMATQDKGAEYIELAGGKRGKVPFPHHQHQARLDDCQICHAVFPQKSGSIKKLQADGKLKKKHVMNKLCTKCHKEKKRAGQKSGPTSCKQCHIKPKTSN